MMRSFVIFAVALLVATQGDRECSALQVWDGPKIIFSKAASADVSQPENQDRITDNVWLTRADIRGIYNIRSEASYANFVSPVDTEWSFGTTDNLGALIFEDWQNAIGSNPPTSLEEDMVLHLITDDIYIDIKFLTWGEGFSAGGFFSYERSTPIPEPAAFGMLLIGLGYLGSVRRHR